ncbi:MAG TPA: tetratricopeptide repeat protein [Pseudonocardiaceae bacterium]|nr:tetratricopeptide repeat protein [Pseudonocardiaceae bacterium]
MVDQLLVDLDADGRVSVSTWWEGEPPVRVGEPVEVAGLLGADELADLRWYLEDYLSAPFGVYEGRGARVADRLSDWGEVMFTALFGAGPGQQAYLGLRMRAAAPGRPEIVLRSASPAWLGLPWELLRDPRLPAPLALDGIGLSRGLPDGASHDVFDVGGQRLRVLMVIARPADTRDVGYRMIARPLLRRLAVVRGKVELEVLRPPTLAALAERLRAAREAGDPFQIVHFDGHGSLSGDVGTLVFERPGGGAHHVGADEIAAVLAAARVPVVVLNACQSGAVGKQLAAALATRLLAGGAVAVVAMAYRVYAVAAAEFMTAFYERLFAGDTVGDAVRAGRSRMVRRPGRPSPRGELPLADWAVPVYYRRGDVRFAQLRVEPGARASLDERLDRLREPTEGAPDDPLDAAEEFVGRDGLFHTLEGAADADRVVVLHGPGGSGKTELAKAFARWWRDTKGVARPELVVWHSFEPGVASFGLDGVVTAIGLRVFGTDFARHAKDRRRELVRDLLREQRLLLVWDNFEAVATMPDPTAATPPLDEAGRRELRDFLHGVAAAGHSVILVTSRTPEAWLHDLRRIPVGGLAIDEAIEYADQILRAIPSAQPRRADRAFADLLRWLDGHPLSMRLTLPHLATTDPAELLASLHGTRPVPAAADDAAAAGADVAAGRTGSLSASIAYSIAHLDPADRGLLVAVGLCHGIASDGLLSALSHLDPTPARFRDVPTERWTGVLDRAAHVGLLTKLAAGLYGIHPALPAYLAAQWRAESPDTYEEERAATLRALLDVYAALGAALESDIEAGDAARAYRVIRLHRRTMGHLLGYAIDNRLWPAAGAIMSPLNAFWERRGLTEEADGWTDRVQAALAGPDGSPPRPDLPGGRLWLLLVGTRVGRLIRARDLDAAEALCRTVLAVLQTSPEYEQRRADWAAVHSRLGGVAEHRGHWDEAEHLYRESLDIVSELGDRIGLSRAYRELGGIAEHRGQWDAAERWYRQSLVIKRELGDQRGVALAMDMLGGLAEKRGGWDDAEVWYRDSLSISEELGDEDGMGRSYHALGLLAQRRHRLDEAEQWYHRSLPIAERAHDRLARTVSYLQLGMLALLRGKVDDAEQWLRQSLAMAAELGARDYMFQSYQMLGAVAQTQGSLDEAERLYQQAVAIAEESADKHAMSQVCQALGRLAHDRKQWDEGERWYHRAIEICTELGQTIGIAVAYYQLGELAEARGTLDDALAWTVRSTALFHQGRYPETGGPYPLLARLVDRLGWQMVEDCWWRLIGARVPADVRRIVAAHQEGG